MLRGYAYAIRERGIRVILHCRNITRIYYTGKSSSSIGGCFVDAIAHASDSPGSPYDRSLVDRQRYIDRNAGRFSLFLILFLGSRKSRSWRDKIYVYRTRKEHVVIVARLDQCVCVYVERTILRHATLHARPVSLHEILRSVYSGTTFFVPTLYNTYRIDLRYIYTYMYTIYLRVQEMHDWSTYLVRV